MQLVIRVIIITKDNTANYNGSDLNIIDNLITRQILPKHYLALHPL